MKSEKPLMISSGFLSSSFFSLVLTMGTLALAADVEQKVCMDNERCKLPFKCALQLWKGLD